MMLLLREEKPEWLLEALVKIFIEVHGKKETINGKVSSDHSVLVCRLTFRNLKFDLCRINREYITLSRKYIE